VSFRLPLALLFGMLVGAASMIAFAPAAFASCAYAADAPENLQRADVVFTGEIMGDRAGMLGAQRELTFKVDQVYKGEAYAEQLVVSSGSEGKLTIAGSGPFLVLARYDSTETKRPAAKLTSDSCSGTRPGPAPASLGTGRPPVAGSSARASRHPELLIGVGVVFVVGAIAVNRWASRRRQPPPR
jgi:hypothetical protein